MMIGCVLISACVGVFFAAFAWLEAGFLWGLLAYVLSGAIGLLMVGCYSFWAQSPGRTAASPAFDRTGRAASKLPVK